jgi:hypothetical protein
MSFTDKLKSQIARPLTVGIVSALAAKAMGGDWSADLPLLGVVSKPVFYGVVGAASSFGSEILHNFALPYLPQSSQAVTIENALLAPAIHAALNVAVVSVVFPAMASDVGLQEPILIGIGSEIVGGYSFDNFIKPALLQ